MSYTRHNPYFVTIAERSILSSSDLNKRTYHVSLNINPTEFTYKPGDAVGILPHNDFTIVEMILENLQIKRDTLIINNRKKQEVRFFDFLLHDANIAKITLAIADLLGIEEAQAKGSEWLQSHDLLSLLRERNTQPSAQDLANVLLPLLPRYYSIASSQSASKNRIDLLVAALSFEVQGEARSGVASNFLCDLAQIERTPIPIFLHPTHDFVLPTDSNQSMIMIGPGTGVAPFRAFLQERFLNQAKGAHWLFFGERHRATHFFYQDFFQHLVGTDFLKLETAFSRDQAQKRYVQHIMEEKADELWQWIQNGSIVYICGDASKMAKDVIETLQEIVKHKNNLSTEEAILWIRSLKKSKQLLLDIY